MMLGLVLLATFLFVAFGSRELRGKGEKDGLVIKVHNLSAPATGGSVFPVVHCLKLVQGEPVFAINSAMATGAVFSAISSGTKKPKSAWGNILLTGAVAGWNAAIFPTQYNVCDNTYSRDLKKFDSLCTPSALLQTYTFCPDTAQECLGINLSDEEIAMQYCLWNVNEDNVPSSDSFKLSTFANEPPTGVQTPNHAFLSTYVGAALGTSSGSVLGAYTYLWPAGSCEGIPDCELLEKGYYSLQSAIVKTPNALVASLVYNAETGPIAGRRGPTTIAFVDNKKAYWKTCNTAVDAASGLSVNTDCIYTVRYNSGEDFAVTKELFGSYAVAGVALAGDVTSPVVSFWGVV